MCHQLFGNVVVSASCFILSLLWAWMGFAQELIATPLGVAFPEGVNCPKEGVVTSGSYSAAQVPSGVPVVNPVQSPSIDVTKKILTLAEWERLNETAPPAPIDQLESAKVAIPVQVAVPVQVTNGGAAACDGTCQLVPGNTLWVAFMDLVRQSAKEEAKAALAMEMLETQAREHEQEVERVREVLKDSEAKLAKLEREKRGMEAKLEELEVALKKKSTELERVQGQKKSESAKKQSNSKK